MYAYTFSGKRYDVGDKLGFLAATIEFALKREDLREDFVQYLRGLIHDDAYSSILSEVALSEDQ